MFRLWVCIGGVVGGWFVGEEDRVVVGASVVFAFDEKHGTKEDEY